MKNYLPLFFFLFLFSAEIVAQEKLSKKDTDEIRFNARRKVEQDLPELLNTLNLDDLGDYERKTLMLNSYLISNNQVFYADGVIIEDDLKPDRQESSRPIDVPVGKYLSNFDLFYKKSSSPTIEVTNVVVGTVKERNEQYYIQVSFNSHFKGSHKTIKVPYKVEHRVAELRAEKVEKQWVTLITSIRFLKDESPTVANKIETIESKLSEKALLDLQEKKNQEALSIAKEDQRKKDELKKKEEEEAEKIAQLKKEEEAKQEQLRQDEEAKQVQLKKEAIAKQERLQQEEETKQQARLKKEEELKLKEQEEQLIKRNEEVKTDLSGGVDNEKLSELKAQLSSYKGKRTLWTLVSLVSIGSGVGAYFIANGKYDDYIAKINSNNQSYRQWYASVYSGQSPPTDEIAVPMSSSEFAPTAMLSLGAGIGVGLISTFLKGKYGRLTRNTQKQINNIMEKKTDISLKPTYDFTNQTSGLSLVVKF